MNRFIFTIKVAIVLAVILFFAPRVQAQEIPNKGDNTIISTDTTITIEDLKEAIYSRDFEVEQESKKVIITRYKRLNAAASAKLKFTITESGVIAKGWINTGKITLTPTNDWKLVWRGVKGNTFQLGIIEIIKILHSVSKIELSSAKL